MSHQSLKDYLNSQKLENELKKSSESLHDPPPELVKKKSPIRKKLLRFSPKRLISTSTPSSPVVPRRSMGSVDFENRRSSLSISPLRKALSGSSIVSLLSESTIDSDQAVIKKSPLRQKSPPKAVLQKSPPKAVLQKSPPLPKSSSLHQKSSPPLQRSSPLRQKSSSAKAVLQQVPSSDLLDQTSSIICHQCRRHIKVDLFREKFLAVKCPCPCPPFYFCNRECQRIHWISLHEHRDQCFEELNFPEVAHNCQVPLTWDKPYDQQYQHDLDDYIPCSLFHFDSQKIDSVN